MRRTFFATPNRRRLTLTLASLAAASYIAWVLLVFTELDDARPAAAAGATISATVPGEPRLSPRGGGEMAQVYDVTVSIDIDPIPLEPVDGGSFVSVFLIVNNGTPIGFGGTVPSTRQPHPTRPGDTWTQYAGTVTGIDSFEARDTAHTIQLRARVVHASRVTGEALDDFETSTISISIPARMEDPTTGTSPITVIKDAEPDDAQKFTFTLTGPSGSDTAMIDDDGDGSNGTNSHRFGDLAAGTYFLTEGAVDGWGIRNITCTGAISVAEGDRAVTLEIAEDANVECLFINRGSGDVQIALDALTEFADDEDFGFVVNRHADGGDFEFVTAFSLTGDFLGEDSFEELELSASETYRVSALSSVGTEVTRIDCTGGGDVRKGPRHVDIALRVGDEIVCTFARGRASATIITNLDTLPDDTQDVRFLLGQEVTAEEDAQGVLGVRANFTLDDDGHRSIPSATPSRTEHRVQPGSYSVLVLPFGANARHRPVDVTCQGGGGFNSPSPDEANFTVGAGQTVECTFTVERDSDGDGLADRNESLFGTDPNNADTDGGGVDDGAEVLINGTDPLDGSDDISLVPLSDPDPPLGPLPDPMIPLAPLPPAPGAFSDPIASEGSTLVVYGGGSVNDLLDSLTGAEALTFTSDGTVFTVSLVQDRLQVFTELTAFFVDGTVPAGQIFLVVS